MKKFRIIFFLLICSFCTHSHGQKSKKIFVNQYGEITDSSGAVQINEITIDGIGGSILTKWVSGIPISKKSYSNLETSTLHGESVYYYSNGMIERIENYMEGKLHGKIRNYKKNGDLDGIKIFEFGKFIRNESPSSAYNVVEKMPQFPGGEVALFNFLRHKIKYPGSARSKEISGRVYVSFIVMNDGTLDDIRVIRSPDESLSEEAVRVVRNMPKWIPGEQDGMRVNVRYNLPINFQLK